MPAAVCGTPVQVTLRPRGLVMAVGVSRLPVKIWVMLPRVTVAVALVAETVAAALVAEL